MEIINQRGGKKTRSRAQLLARIRRLESALRDCSGRLWEALGGADDEQCRAVADRACKRYERLLNQRPSGQRGNT